MTRKKVIGLDQEKEKDKKTRKELETKIKKKLKTKIKNKAKDPNPRKNPIPLDTTIINIAEKIGIGIGIETGKKIVEVVEEKELSTQIIKIINKLPYNLD